MPASCDFSEIFGHICTLKKADLSVDLCQAYQDELFIVRTYVQSEYVGDCELNTQESWEPEALMLAKFLRH